MFIYSQVSPVYQSTAQVLVVRKRPEPIPVNGAGPNQQIYVEDYLTTHAILIRSQEILRRAAKILESERSITIPGGMDWLTFLSNGLTVTREIRDGNAAPTNVLNLAFRGGRRDDCPLIVSAIIQAYQEFLNETYGNLNKEFVKQMQEAEHTLKGDIEKRKQDYENIVKENYLVFQSKDKLGGVIDRIGRYETRYADLVLRQQQIERDLELIRSSISRGDKKDVILKLIQSTDPNRPIVAERRGEEQALQALLLQEEEMRQELGKDHPQMVSLRRRIEALRERIGDPGNSDAKPDPLDLQLRLLKGELDLNREMQKTVLTILAKERDAATALAAYLHRVEVARDAITPYQQLYDNVNARLKQLQLSPDSDIYSARTIVDAAPGIKVAPISW